MSERRIVETQMAQPVADQPNAENLSLIVKASNFVLRNYGTPEFIEGVNTRHAKIAGFKIISRLEFVNEPEEFDPKNPGDLQFSVRIRADKTVAMFRWLESDDTLVDILLPGAWRAEFVEASGYLNFRE